MTIYSAENFDMDELTSNKVINFFISVLVIIINFGFIKPFMMPKLINSLTCCLSVFNENFNLFGIRGIWK